MTRRYSRAADSRSMGRPLHNTVRDCSEDPTLGPARPRPSAGGPLFTPVDATLCVVERWEDASTPPARRKRLLENGSYHISWNGPGRYVRRVTGPFAGFATGAPATTPTRVQ